MPNRLKLLLAEDEEVDYVCIQRALENNSRRSVLRRVIDGREAKRYLEGEGLYSDRSEFPLPDVVILDLKMPRLTGLQVLEWVRGHPTYCTLPVIIMSSSSLRSEIEKAYKLGASTYFVKPISLAEFQALYELLLPYWQRAANPWAS